MIRRSKSANLTISLTIDSVTILSFCDVIRISSHRVGKITVEKIRTEGILEDAFEDVPDSPISRHQSLSISLSDFHHHDSENFDTLRFILGIPQT